MKIAMIAPDRRTEFGISKYSLLLSSALRKNGVKVDEFFFNRGSLLSFLKLIPKLRGYDLVHLQHEYNIFGRLSAIFLVPLSLALASAWTGGNWVVTMHTVGSSRKKMLSKSAPWLFIKQKIIYPLQNFVVSRFARSVIAHSSDQAETLVKEFGVPREKVRVFTHGIEENVPRFDKAAAKKELGLKGSVYLLIGNITPLKGLDAVIRHAREIGKTIVVAGNVNPFDKAHYQPYLDGLQKYVKDNNLEEFVRFDISSVTDKDRLWWVYLSAADLVLLPYKEATSSGIFAQAMAAGRPVIASKKPFFEDIRKEYRCLEVADPETGFAQAIKRAMKPANLSLMEKEAKRFAQDHSMGRLGKEYAKFYQTLIKA